MLETQRRCGPSPQAQSSAETDTHTELLGHRVVCLVEEASPGCYSEQERGADAGRSGRREPSGRGQWRLTMIAFKIHRGELDKGERGTVIPERGNNKSQGMEMHLSILQSGRMCVRVTEL